MLEATATTPTAHCELDGHLRAQAERLPAPAGLTFPQQRSTVAHAYDGALAAAEVLYGAYDTPEEHQKIDAFVAKVRAWRHAAEVNLRAADTRMAAEIAQSDRMRGTTSSVFDGAIAIATPRRAESSGTPRARRASSANSSSSDDPEPEPPGARACAWCRRDISHKNRDARYCSDSHRALAHRAGDRANPDRVAERALSNGAVSRAARCGCKPKRNLVFGGVCFQCGLERDQLRDGSRLGVGA